MATLLWTKALTPNKGENELPIMQQYRLIQKVEVDPTDRKAWNMVFLVGYAQFKAHFHLSRYHLSFSSTNERFM